MRGRGNAVVDVFWACRFFVLNYVDVEDVQVFLA